MSIATKLTTINSQVAAAHGAVTAKGGTGQAGTSTLAAAINSIPAGGETVIPTVYAKLERIVLRTPADAVADYAGVWTRDSAWLALSAVPMTFQGGSFGWSGTRALARYTKTVNGTTVYLYLYYLDGYYYDDTTAWDAVGVANAQQFFDNIGTLGWSGEMYMNYCFSTTNYTPAQITNYNSVSGNTPFGSYSSAYAWAMPSPFTGPWDLLGLEDMGMGSGDILQTYTSKTSASVTLAVSFDMENSSMGYEFFSTWSGNSSPEHPRYGRLFDSTQTDKDTNHATGTWNPTVWDDTRDITSSFKKREWVKPKSGSSGWFYAVEYSFMMYHGTSVVQYGCWPFDGGFQFKLWPSPPYPQNQNNYPWEQAWGQVCWPTKRCRRVNIVSGGSGYAVGDEITIMPTYRKRESDWYGSVDASGNRVPYSGYTNWGDLDSTEWRHMRVVVTGIDANGSITGLTDLTRANMRKTDGIASVRWFDPNYVLYDSATGTYGATQAGSVVATDGAGTGFSCTLEEVDLPIEYMGGENVNFLVAEFAPGPEGDSYMNQVGGSASYNKFSKIRELYKLTSSLSPIA